MLLARVCLTVRRCGDNAKVADRVERIPAGKKRPPENVAVRQWRHWEKSRP